MKKIAPKLACFLCGVLLCSCFTACSFFETPGSNTTSSAASSNTATKSSATAISDEDWAALAAAYAETNQTYVSCQKAYEAIGVKNEEIEGMLSQAKAFMESMGASHRSEILPEDVSALQELMTTMQDGLQQTAQVLQATETKPAETPAATKPAKKPAGARVNP